MPAAARPTTSNKTEERFSEEERDAMKERARELKAPKRRSGKAAEVDGEAVLLAKIAQMSPADRALAERVHKVVKAAVPELDSTTWYGMPAYARNGKTVCFFQAAEKFKTRYATFGFSDEAKLDDGALWPNAYALTMDITETELERVGALVKKAVG